MKKRLNGYFAAWLFTGALLAFEALMLTDMAVVWFGAEMEPTAGAAIFASLIVFFCFVFRNHAKRMGIIAILIPFILSASGFFGYLGWNSFSSRAGYQAPDTGKEQIYGGRKVMLIVPHQDDELNILGGVLEEYVKYGSEVYAVFSTNGDYYDPAQVRYQEALRVFETLGIPEEHVFFLGYGDGWKEGGPHIYNAEPDAVMESYCGKTETYGSAQHPAYRTGRSYTLGNLTEDLQSVILECTPDVIFCSDYDDHTDHKALSLLFDKVMGQILKENPGYTPVVYKTYAYGTAWMSEPDYYAKNVLSTKTLFEEPYCQEPEVYRWEDRVRFPVAGSVLSRSLVESEGYKLLGLHESQYAVLMAASVINGDRVAWQRHTDSMVLHSDVVVSSGNSGLLNDFMLIENHNLVDENHDPYDGVWIPETGDEEKTVTVTLPQTGDVSSVVLYDHPSEDDNVLNAVISFDDGTMIQTGPLDPHGAATSVSVNQKNVTAFTVTLEETEGESAGLSEIEAFAKQPDRDGRFLKMMDREGNFLYDYQTEPDGVAEIAVHVHGELPELTQEYYSVETEGGTGTARLEDGKIHVTCPAGEEMTVTITCSAADISDSVYVRNPGRLERIWMNLWQSVEEAVFIRYSRAEQKKLLIFSIPDKISYVIRHMG